MPFGKHKKLESRLRECPINYFLDDIQDAIIHQTSQTIPLPITTRSIGFSTAQFFHKLYNLVTVIPEYDIYAFYRASLGIFEAKMAFIKNSYDHLRSYQSVYDFKRYLNYNYNWKTTTPIARLLNSIGFLKCNEEYFCPIFTKNNYDSSDKLIPQSEHLTLSNLRETVISLCDPSTPAKIRQKFFDNCSIPGTNWMGSSDDPILMNANQIIPEIYTDQNLEADLEIMNEVIRCALRLLPKYIDEVNLLDKNGSTSLFVSNNQDCLRIEGKKMGEQFVDYYKRCSLIGEIDDFWNIHGVTKMQQIDGCLTLPGELPISAGHAYPLYSIRDALVAAQRTSLTYTYVCNFF